MEEGGHEERASDKLLAQRTHVFVRVERFGVALEVVEKLKIILVVLSLKRFLNNTVHKTRHVRKRDDGTIGWLN